MIGGLNATNILLSYVIEPYGFRSGDASAMGGTLITTGIIGMTIIPPYVIKQKKYKIALGILIIGSALSILSFIVALKPE